MEVFAYSVYKPAGMKETKVPTRVSSIFLNAIPLQKGNALSIKNNLKVTSAMKPSPMICLKKDCH
jgi:hypothetical protein